MRHTMLVPLQLLVRDTPPTPPNKAGDLYFNSIMRTVLVYDGLDWVGLASSSGDEVLIDMVAPYGPDTELWVDLDDSTIHGIGAFLPLTGGELTGPLVITPINPSTTALVVSNGGADVEKGGIRIQGQQVDDPEYAASKGYVDSLFSSIGGTTGPRKHTAIIGDGMEREHTVAHNLDTENIVVSLWAVATKEMLTAHIRIMDADTIQIRFDDIPGIGSVKVMILSMA